MAARQDRATWERVLAAVEADAMRTEALLHAPMSGAEESLATYARLGEIAPDQVNLIPADWTLPSAVELPSLDTMPPVPAELSDRILALRSQIMCLQAELSEAMRTVARTQPMRPAATVQVEVPAYIDRRL